MKRYRESLNNTPGPVRSEDVPDIKIDMRGIAAYAKKKGVQPADLPAEVKEQFILKSKEAV